MGLDPGKRLGCSSRAISRRVCDFVVSPELLIYVSRGELESRVAIYRNKLMQV
jgi:hypothetical protein